MGTHMPFTTFANDSEFRLVLVVATAQDSPQRVNC